MTIQIDANKIIDAYDEFNECLGCTFVHIEETYGDDIADLIRNNLFQFIRKEKPLEGTRGENINKEVKTSTSL
jgi:hypothetical protein